MPYGKRKMKELIDFDFICEKVKDVYRTALKHIKKHVKFMDTKKKKNDRRNLINST